MPVDNNNTNCIVTCGVCGIKTTGCESKVNLWLKLHSKKNHPKDKCVIRIEEQYGIRPTRRQNDKAEYIYTKNLMKVNPSDIFVK